MKTTTLTLPILLTAALASPSSAGRIRNHSRNGTAFVTPPGHHIRIKNHPRQESGPATSPTPPTIDCESSPPRWIGTNGLVVPMFAATLRPIIATLVDHLARVADGLSEDNEGGELPGPPGSFTSPK